MSWLGAGIGFRGQHRRPLVDGAGPAVLEIVPDHFFARPDRLAALAERYTLVFHDVAMSLATDFAGAAAETHTARVERIRALFEFGRPEFFSDHLALTAGPDGTDLGHLAPVWYTREALAAVSDRVRALQDQLGVPIAIENITAPFVIGEADFDEADFFCALVEATGCGVLLDLSNVCINARNFGFDPKERLERYPLQAVWQVHLAGGHCSEGWWIDGHDAPVDDESFELLGWLRGRAPLRTAIVERDSNLPPLAVLLAEAERADAVWRGE